VDEPGDGGSVASGYVAYGAFPSLIVRTLVILTALGGLSVWAAATGRPGPGWVFTGIWFAALGWNAYFWLRRIAWRLELTDRTLDWRAVAHSGSVAIGDILRVRPSRAAVNLVVLEVSGGRPVVALASKGFQGFVDDLARRVPDLPITTPRAVRAFERWPARSGHRKMR
jgi:hypothetical protein